MTSMEVLMDTDPTAEWWKPIPGTDGCFEVSDHGRVRSWLVPFDRTRTKRLPEPRVLPQTNSANGYRSVYIRMLHQTYPQMVHRLVMLAFVGEPPAGNIVCHWDDDRSNNVLTNLRYGSRADNVADAVRNGIQVGVRAQTHCNRGHLRTPENTNLKPRSNGHGLVRSCKLCAHITYVARRDRVASHPCETTETPNSRTATSRTVASDDDPH